jgi:predicted N-acetyltransferase YhbS
MNLNIKQTDKSEYHITEFLTREIFWNLFTSGCTDHFILHKLRKSKDYIPQLDLVVIYNNKIVGHIISSKAKVVDNQHNEHEVLCVGPFAISPELQNKGIGTQLLKHSISMAKELAYKGMILFGNPNYYHRFGFDDAHKYGISTKDGHNFPQFMALELQKNGLDNITGKFFDDESFQVNEDEFAEFEKIFPKKEKGKPKFPINI